MSYRHKQALYVRERPKAREAFDMTALEYLVVTTELELLHSNTMMSEICLLLNIAQHRKRSHDTAAMHASNTSLLIRKAKIDTKRWVHISRYALVLMNVVQSRDIGGIELNNLHVLIDSRRSDRFSQHHMSFANCFVLVPFNT